MNIRTSVSSATKKFKPSKRVLIGAAIVLVLVALFVLGTIVQVRAERQRQADVRATATAQATKDTMTQKQISDLQTQVTTLQAEKTAACTNYKALSTARATRSLVVTPVAVHCP